MKSDTWDHINKPGTFSRAEVIAKGLGHLLEEPPPIKSWLPFPLQPKSWKSLIVNFCDDGSPVWLGAPPPSTFASRLKKWWRDYLFRRHMRRFSRTIGQIIPWLRKSK